MNAIYRKFKCDLNAWLVCFCCALFLSCSSSTYSEIQQIDIAWNAFKCQNSCTSQIKQQFSAIKGVQNIEINPSLGIASLSWDPSTSLSFEPFRYAAASIGFNLSRFTVKVKGSIQYQENHFYLISSGDRTRFHLIGPLKIESGRYVPEYSLETHPIGFDLKNDLMSLANKKEEITVFGPLFLPTYYPLTLVVEHLEKDKRQESASP